VRGREWQRYAGPAAFLLAATIAILLIRSGLQAGSSPAQTQAPVPTVTRKQVATTTARTTTTKTKKAAQRFWTVQAGDTFAVISTKSGVPVATIERLNPNAKSTSLFIGEKLRLR
jgi:LysM repeat protein